MEDDDWLPLKQTVCLYVGLENDMLMLSMKLKKLERLDLRKSPSEDEPYKRNNNLSTTAVEERKE